MRDITFSKWQGTGNDFILIDDRSLTFPAHDLGLITRLCDRHFGIGSDGLILLRHGADGLAYHMEFFNPDGSKSFCGNGSRCAFAFWSSLTGEEGPVRFSAVDGEHEAAWEAGEVRIGMRAVQGMHAINANMDLIHTGSPHLVIWTDDPARIDLVPEAREHRYNAAYGPGGVNVNFVRWNDGLLEMRTYERGVEAETLSCGTGVTAAALSAMHRGNGGGACAVRTPGGDLSVTAEADGRGGFHRITLRGPVKAVFQGQIELDR